MTSLGVLLFFLLGGYFFSRFDPRTAYGANRMRRDHLFFHCMGVGLLFGALSFAATHAAIPLLFPGLASWWKQQFAAHLSGTAAGSLALGVLSGLLLRFLCSEKWDNDHRVPARLRAGCLWFRGYWYEHYLRRWVKLQGSELEKLLIKSGDRGTPVQLTLDNRKVYIGGVHYFPAEYENSESYVEIKLYASGYRDESTLSITRTNHYAALILNAQEHVQSLEKRIDELRARQDNSTTKKGDVSREFETLMDDFIEAFDHFDLVQKHLVVVIPFDRIVTAMPFDEYVFANMDGHEHDHPEKHGRWRLDFTE